MKMTNFIKCPACGQEHFFNQITYEKCVMFNPLEIHFLCTNCNHIIYITEQAKYIYTLGEE